MVPMEYASQGCNNNCSHNKCFSQTTQKGNVQFTIQSLISLTEQSLLIQKWTFYNHNDPMKVLQ